MNTVTIVDYGLGNLLSVTRALTHCGAEAILTDSAKGIEQAERLILPGVGAYADGMAGLRGQGLIKPLQNYALSGRPFLGICLGMQMLLETNEEFGIHEGLGLIPGKVIAIPATDAHGNPHKIPHIGWNNLQLPQQSSPDLWNHSIFSEIPVGSSAYFVHSFTAVPTDEKHRLADCYYHERLISAAIHSGSIFGCQFHPEKSGSVGLKIIRAFIHYSLD